jgi:PAS domain S-box/diguanylate cyclase (GGDEF) domain
MARIQGHGLILPIAAQPRRMFPFMPCPRSPSDSTAPRRGVDATLWLAAGGYAVAAAGWLVVADRLEAAAATRAAVLGLMTLVLLGWVLHRRDRLRQAAVLDAMRRRLWLLDAIVQGSPDAIYAKDTQGRYLFANREACRRLGVRPEEMLGRTADEFFPPDETAMLQAREQEVLAQRQPLRTERKLTTPSGRHAYAATVGPLLDAQGELVGVFGISQDIDAHKQRETDLRPWAVALQSTRDGVMVTDRHGNIRTVNRAFTEITGYALEDVVGRKPSLLRSGRHDADFYRALWQAIDRDGCWQGEIWNRRRNGDIYPEWLTITRVHDDDGEHTHYVGVFTDISRLKHNEAELERLAHYDPLTQLPNRRLLLARMDQAIAQAQWQDGQAAALHVGLDGFKFVNEGFGHPVGDELLQAVAARLQSRLRQGDLLGRLGGDEFLVLPGRLSEPGEAALLARDLLNTFREPVPLSGGRDVYITASIGISVHPADGCHSGVEMLRNANAAMHHAKELGRNRFCFFTADLQAQAVERLQLEAALKRAVERDQLLLHYQPRVDARSGRMCGVEALLRWDHPEAGLMAPGQFIPVAERSSLILELGAWVIDRACQQAREWIAQGWSDAVVAVNVAARQFTSGHLDTVVQQALARHGVPARALELELTESMLMQEPDAAVDMLRRLKAIGVRLSLDDFGTGYSSLGYLQRFPIDVLKIDRSFVQTIGCGPDGAAIADAVIALAHRLKLRVVAEGVEIEAQRRYLLAQGCDELQGFLFSRPLPPQALALPAPAHALVDG